jgi:membrane protease YdiL (CAAX protease family)
VIRRWVNPLVVTAILFAVLLLFIAAMGKAPRYVGFTLSFAVYAVLVLIVMLAERAHSGKFRHLFTAENLPRQILIGVAIACAMFAVVVLLPLAFGVRAFGGGASSPAGLALMTVKALIFVGFGEEIVFRGYLFERFQEAAGSDVWAVMITAALFGLWHYPAGRSWLQVGMTAIIGAIFAIARLKIPGCTLLTLCVAHGLYDAGIQLIAYFVKE